MFKIIKKLIKIITSNVIVSILFMIFYYLVLFNIILAFICTISTAYVYSRYIFLKERYNQEKFIKFQINCFIKNMGMNCLSNDFNIVDSIEKTLPFLEGRFKKDVSEMLDEINFDFNYAKSLNKLSEKYRTNRIFYNFLQNISIIKEQSNVDTSAKKILKNSSIDSRKYIVNQDRVEKVRIANLKNYLINTLIGGIVIVMVICSLNVYYVQYAHSLMGISINILTICISLYITLIIIKKTYVWSKVE